MRVRRLLVGLVGTVVIFVAGYVILTMFAPQGVYDRLVGVLQETRPESRFIFWELSLRLFAENPVLGAGTGGFANYTHGMGLLWKYSHNLFLELLCEYGLLGAVMGVALIYLLVKHGLRCLRLRTVMEHEVNLILSIVIFGFANAMLSSDIPGQRILWFGCGAMIGLARLAEQTRAEQPDYEPDPGGSELLQA